MNIKQIIFSIIFFTITNNSIFTMDNDNENQLKRPEGYWTQNQSTLLTQITKPESQRESYYDYTKYIGETYCTLSNAGFFAVAYLIKNSHPISAAGLFGAGSASTISHAIPWQSLNIMDRILAVSSVAAVIYDTNLYKPAIFTTAVKKPAIFTSLIATGTTTAIDHYIAYSKKIVKKSNGYIPQSMIIKRKSEHKWVHVLWHILAAWTAYLLLTINLN